MTQHGTRMPHTDLYPFAGLDGYLTTAAKQREMLGDRRSPATIREELLHEMEMPPFDDALGRLRDLCQQQARVLRARDAQMDDGA